MVSGIVYGAFCILLGGSAFVWFVLIRLPRWTLASALVFIEMGAAIFASSLIPGNAGLAVGGVFGIFGVASSVRAARLRRQWRRDGRNWTRDSTSNA